MNNYIMQKNKRNPITVILEDIRSALNVGAIFRTCDAVLAEKLVLTGITPYPPHNKIPKTALGSIDTVPWIYKKNKNDIFSEFNPKIGLVAIEITDDAIDLYNYTFPKNVAIVLGNEISGVSAELLSKCIATIKIPMYGQKESLNVATSCGIVLYEIIRQWNFNK
jgi:23S rRNA (guanosine2251-2'-O)-methyltransferase